MKRILSQVPLALVLCAALVPLAAMADPSAELKVKGSIRPPGCTPTLAAGGTADFGVIPLASLNRNATTTLGQRMIGFSISCTAKIKLALAANDNRKSSVIAGAPAGAFGLGASAGKNIGYYSLTIQSVTGDGTWTSLLRYSNGGTLDVWSPDGSYRTVTNPPGWMPGNSNLGLGPLAFAQTGNSPSAYQTISGTFIIQATVERAANLPSNQEIPLDGSVTLEVQYL